MKRVGVLSLAAVFVVLLAPNQTEATPGVPLWTNFHGVSDSDYKAAAIALDASGNVFVAGQSIAYDQFPDFDFVTLKYSNAGVPLWTNVYDGPIHDHDAASAIAIDGSGNVFVTGFSHGSVRNRHFLTIKYSDAGVPLWTNRFGSDALDIHYHAMDIAVDLDGQVIVAGYSSQFVGNGFYFEYHVIAYSNSGELMWTRHFGGALANRGNSTLIAVDRSNNVFVAGAVYASGNSYDFITLAYSSAGGSLWMNGYDGPAGGDDFGRAIALDDSGNVFVTGASRGITAPIFHTDYLTIKYSNSGEPLWTNRYNGLGNELDSPTDIAVDGLGNVFVTGLSDYPDNEDLLTIKYSNAGVPLWTNRYDSPAGDYEGGTAIGLDKSGNVFVTGYSENENVTTCVTIAYSNGGHPIWTNQFARVDDDYGRALAVDAAGNVFVTGWSRDINQNAAIVTIKYAAVDVLPVHLESEFLNHQLVLSWTNAGFSLQSGPAIAGTFTNISGATSRYTNSISGAQQFFRLISN